MKRLLLLALALVLAAVSSSSAAGPFASSVDSGDLPHAYTTGSLETPTRAPRLQVRSSSAATLEISIDVQCSRGSHSASKEIDLGPQIAPVDRPIKLTMKHADRCFVSVDAGFEDFEQAGWISVKLYR